MLKVGTIILTIALAVASLYGIFVIVAPDVIVNSTLEAQGSGKLENIQDEGYVYTVLAETRHMGIFAVTIGICGYFILFAAFRKAEKWAWWVLLIVGVIVWGYGLVMNSIEGDMLNLILHVICAVIYFIGLLLPVKAFFAKKA